MKIHVIRIKVYFWQDIQRVFLLKKILFDKKIQKVKSDKFFESI